MYYRPMDTITYASTYDELIEHLEVGVREVMADFGDEAELSEDEVYVDLAASILIDAKPAVAREVLRCTVGFVPQSLEAAWRAQKK